MNATTVGYIGASMIVLLILVYTIIDWLWINPRLKKERSERS